MALYILKDKVSCPVKEAPWNARELMMWPSLCSICRNLCVIPTLEIKKMRQGERQKTNKQTCEWLNE